MKQLRPGAFAGVDHGVVDLLVDRHCAHRNRAVGQGLGHGDEVGPDLETLRRKPLPGTAEAGDDFIEYQQDCVLVANLAQALEVAGRRHIHANGTGNRLNETRGYAVAAMHGDDPFQIVCQVCTMLRLAQLIALIFLPGMTHMTDVGQPARRECLTVAHHPGQRHATEIYPVICPFAGHKTRALGLAASTVIRQGDFHRAVHRLGAGVGEKHFVQAFRQQFAQAFGQFKGQRRSALKMRGEVQGQQLFANGFGDLAAAMAGGTAEQPRAAIEQRATFAIPVVHTLGADKQLRGPLELAVIGKRQPLVIQIHRHAYHS